MQTEQKNRQKEGEAKETVYESVLIHLNTYKITRMFAFSFT